MMKQLQGLQCHQIQWSLFRKGRGRERGRGMGGEEEGGGQTPPTIVVSTIDYTSPEKTAKTQSCLLHASNKETTTP